jgi:hypothetical protein
MHTKNIYKHLIINFNRPNDATIKIKKQITNLKNKQNEKQTISIWNS